MKILNEYEFKDSIRKVKKDDFLNIMQCAILYYEGYNFNQLSRIGNYFQVTTAIKFIDDLLKHSIPNPKYDSLNNKQSQRVGECFLCKKRKNIHYSKEKRICFHCLKEKGYNVDWIIDNSIECINCNDRFVKVKCYQKECFVCYLNKKEKQNENPRNWSN